ncbi:hypothetical protein [Leptolyngbya sp. BL0902]|uniref:hypothetical protein n=1 Tax=Leptolyngbya sp. BL0902 TaxID=1115757 RepID=UPI0018E7BCF1|nr:hypothetical protein [Leptolyngbya sp. BL0902]
MGQIDRRQAWIDDPGMGRRIGPTMGFGAGGLAGGQEVGQEVGRSHPPEEGPMGD